MGEQQACIRRRRLMALGVKMCTKDAWLATCGLSAAARPGEEEVAAWAELLRPGADRDQKHSGATSLGRWRRYKPSINGPKGFLTCFCCDLCLDITSKITCMRSLDSWWGPT
jgi:hypothetical protein